MTRLQKAALMVSMTIGLAACTARGQTSEPVVVEFASQTLRIPRDREFTGIFVGDHDTAGRTQEPRAVSLRICDQHVTERPEFACHLHGEQGTWTLIRDARVGSEFKLLKERPIGMKGPGDVDLVPLDWEDRRHPRTGNCRE